MEERDIRNGAPALGAGVFLLARPVLDGSWFEKKIVLIAGGADYQIVPSVDMEAWKTEISGWGEGAANVSLMTFEGLNHLMTPSQGIFAGHYKEYEMPGRVPEDVIAEIAAFVK